MTTLLLIVWGCQSGSSNYRADPTSGSVYKRDTVLINDGRCPPGQVTKSAAVYSVSSDYWNREYSCVPCEGNVSAVDIETCGQAIVRATEPRSGTLPTGAVVYVDDYSCPDGEIKKLTGGSSTMPRQRECVSRQGIAD